MDVNKTFTMIVLTGLGDPHRLAVRNVLGGGDRVPEGGGSIANSGVLEVRIAVHAQEVTSSDHFSVRRIHPSSPGIHMANFLVVPLVDHSSDVVDLVRQRGRSGIASVEILATNGHSKDPVAAVCLDCCLQCILLCLVVGGIFGPDSNQDLGPSRDGSGYSVSESVAIAGSVQADGVEVLRQGLQLLERGGPLCSSFAGAVWVVCGNVEAFR